MGAARRGAGQARLGEPQREARGNEGDWEVISDIVALAERKEAEVFEALFALRERQLRDVQEDCTATQARLQSLYQPRQAPPGSSLQRSASTGGLECKSKPSLAASRGMTEVRGHTAGWSLSRAASCSSPLASPPAKSEASAPRSRTKERLRRLREKDKLLSLGMSWLLSELEDAKTQIRAVVGGSDAGAWSQCCSPSSDGQRLVRRGDQADSLVSQDEPDSVDTRVAQFLEDPFQRHFRLLFCRVKAGVYLVGSSLVHLRTTNAPGYADSGTGLEASPDRGKTWMSLAEFMVRLEQTQGDLIVQAREITRGARCG